MERAPRLEVGRPNGTKRRAGSGAERRERTRIARQLYDETLHGLVLTRLQLGAALRSGSPAALEEAVAGSVERLGADIESLRALIGDLRALGAS